MYCFPSAPINSLPVELLAYIFHLGTHEPLRNDRDRDDDDDDCQPFNADSVKAPLVYASVCWHWRRVALSTPSLFTSLCITPALFHQVGTEEALDTTGIASYLSLSQNCLVDILIDARDQEWDFEDDDGGWFSAEHMSTAMGVLLPHLGRWRSLSILTDVWAPMHAALRPLEVYLSAFGAPHLQSLRLMRCDAYAAHAAVDPGHGHVFLSSVQATNGAWILPRLRHLTLRGVPAAWTPLSAILPDGLQTLELSFHPLAAQPSVPELASLLRAAPQLSRLVMNGSGPSVPAESTNTPWDPEPVSLPLLDALTLGYTSAAAGLALLDVLSAPHLHTLTLEDATHPADTVPVDAAPLLTRLFPSPAVQQPPFPALAHLALRRAHLAAHPPPDARVASLELVGTHPAALTVLATQRLCVRGPLAFPVRIPTPNTAFARGADGGFRFGAGAVTPEEGLAATAAALRALVDALGPAAPKVICLHEAAYAARAEGVEAEEVWLGATPVRVFRRVVDDEDEDEDTVMGSEPECGWDGEEEAFKVGGVFNDPVFDARYGYVG